ncbi:MAG: hypothetical protein HeimC3_27130 [Candidatus Heimdallarchaeota archaeon LC_3]|nr:MAG: hypothetical protein HeimC3_27130 [Candidatus Heimdallarchaeota archaeon LC_3]
MYNYFIVSSKTWFERNALSETFNLLMKISRIKNPEVFAQTLNIRGLGLIQFKDIKIDFSEKNLKIINENIDELKYCEKIIPLNEFLRKKMTLDDLSKEINPHLSIIKEKDKWKIEIKKRQTSFKDKELISSIASLMKNGSVDLTNPDWIIHINIVRNWIGFGIIKPQFVLKLAENRQKMSK